MVDPLEAAVERSWELRFIILLWLAHLLLTPFDLSTISSLAPDAAADLPPQDIGAFIPSPDSPFPEKLSALPQLCKTLLLLATKVLPSPSQRESDAAALLMVRLAIRRDMRALGLLEAVVEWCLRCWEEEEKKPTGEEDIDLLSTHESTINPLFLRTGALKVLAGLLTQSESGWVKQHIPKIWALVAATEDKAGADWTAEEPSTGREWASAGVRKVATKIYRWIGGMLLLSGGSSEVVEDVIGRLLHLLGDRDTNVRFAASKSLGVLTSKLPEEMASEVVDAVVGGFDEDVLYKTEDTEPIPSDGGGKSILAIFGDSQETNLNKKQLLVLVSPEKWHGLTLTLATFLRQRAIKPHKEFRAVDGEDGGESTTPLFKLIVHRILTALTFDQRKTTFSLGSNVRDAACYAAWALARSYYTKELLTIPLPEQYAAYPDPEHIPPNIIQLLATNLIATACLDPVGNIRRAASAALQELVGRHPNVVEEGIKIVQTVDYSAVSVRRRASTEVARDAAGLGRGGYWFGLARWGIVEGWRGVGSGDVEGRRIAANGLGALVGVRLANEQDAQHVERVRRLLGWLISRASKEAAKDVEVRHGVYFAIAEVFEGLDSLIISTTGTSTKEAAVFTPLQQSLILDIFHPLKGRDFVHPPLRPELTAESCCRLVTALCKSRTTLLTPPLPVSIHRLNLAIVEATLEFRGEDAVLEQVIPASREVFRTLGSASEGVVQGWCRRVTSEALTTTVTAATPAATPAGGSGMGRKRGFVGGLGEVIGVMLSPEYSLSQHGGGDGLLKEGINVLVAAATRKNNVEMRVAGIKGIMRGVMAHRGGDSTAWLPGVVSALCKGLDDYSVDTRGDVGSWVRTESIEAVMEGWRSGVLGFGLHIPNPGGAGKEEEVVDVMTMLIPRLVRLAVEKLDKLRSRAIFALKLILHDQPKEQEHAFAGLEKCIDFSLPHEIYLDATTQSYFTSLLPILSYPGPKHTLLTHALLSGYVLSAGSGTDSLLRDAGGALWNYLDRPKEVSADVPLLRAADGFLLGLKNDRILGATLETLGAGLESGVLGCMVSRGDWGKGAFMAVQEAVKLGKGKGGVGRVVAAVRVYRGLGIACIGESRSMEAHRVGALVRRKLVGMLAHPWPVVRREVAEGLFLCLSLGVEKEEGVEGEKGTMDVKGAVDVLVETDWMGRLEALRGGKGGKGAERGVKGESDRVKKLLGLG